MCYQKFHTCRYCGLPYNCFENNYTCATINHDVEMEMCSSCKEKLEDKLKDIDLENVDLMNFDLDALLKDNKDE